MVRSEQALRREAGAAMRTVIAATLAVAVATTASTIGPQSKPALVWNGSSSAPRGFYRVALKDDLAIGTWVLVRAPGWAQAMAAARRYVPANVPLIKQIAAMPGDTVCRANRKIGRKGRVIAVALARDHDGRALPDWKGCIRLAAGKFFVINTPPHSFDSRYFGPVGRDQIIEELVPLWTF